MKAAPFASLVPIRAWMAGMEGKASCSQEGRGYLTRGVLSGHYYQPFQGLPPLLPSLLASADHTVTFRKHGSYWDRTPSGIETASVMSAQDPRGTLKDGILSRRVCLPILGSGDLASSEASVACVGVTA